MPEPPPISEAVPVDVTGTEISVLIPRAAPIPKPERVCPHGGIILGKITICAQCDRSGEENDLFGVAVLHICRKAALNVRVATSTIDDAMMTAVAALVEPKNRTAIFKAKEPDAMAFVIAKRAITKMYRSRSVKSLPVGWMRFPLQPDKEEASTNTRLTKLSDYAAVSEEAQKWQQACFDRVRTFPGIGLLWTQKNLTWLQLVLDEAKRRLPTKPFSVWMVINMRLGLSEGMNEHGWCEIAEQVTTFKEITERMVRYAYTEGLNSMKAHLINSLMPSEKLTGAE